MSKKSKQPKQPKQPKQLSKKSEKILFKTIEQAIDYGIARDSYSDFSFQELYNLILRLENP